jgi:hypothetical protein
MPAEEGEVKPLRSTWGKWGMANESPNEPET